MTPSMAMRFVSACGAVVMCEEILLTASWFGDQLYRAFADTFDSTEGSFFLVSLHGPSYHARYSLVKSKAEVL